MVLDSEELQVARATIANYESFIIAVYLWNYAQALTLEEKKGVSQHIKAQPGSIFEKNPDLTMKLPSPTHPAFADCIEASKATAGNKLPELRDEVMHLYKLY